MLLQDIGSNTVRCPLQAYDHLAVSLAFGCSYGAMPILCPGQTAVRSLAPSKQSALLKKKKEQVLIAACQYNYYMQGLEVDPSLWLPGKPKVLSD